jgi:hypothetical protein
LPSEMTICTPEALFFNTAKLGPNPDLADVVSDPNEVQKFNEFIVYDQAQVKMRYLVEFSYKKAK